MRPGKRKPAACKATGFQNTSKGLAAIDTGTDNPNLRELQAARICERFAVSFHVALTVAHLAYDCGRTA